MKHRIVNIRLAGMIGFLLCGAVALPCLGLPGRWERWWTVSTDHFTLLGNAPRSTILGVGQDLEQLRAALSRISRLRLDPPTPTTIYVFKDAAHLGPYVHKTPDGRPRRLSGAFFRHPHANHILINGEDPRRARTVVFHEYVHFFMAYNLPAVPLWFEEGLAEVYSTFESDSGHAHIGKAVPHHLQWLRTREWIPLQEFLAVDRQSPIYNEGSRQGSYYAQSWLLAHYLLHGRGDGDALDALLTALRSSPPEEALARSLGLSLTELERFLKRYAEQDVHLSKRVPVALPTEPSESSWRRLSRAETLVALGSLLALQPDRRGEADLHFQTALERDPNRTDAWIGLGLAAEKDDDLRAAVGAYAHALKSRPENELAATLSARARLAGGEDPRLVRTALRRVTDGGSDFPLAWQLLAATYTHADATPSEAREGLSVFLQALRLAPEHHRLARALYRLYDRLGLHREAAQLDAEYFRPRGLSPAVEPVP